MFPPLFFDVFGDGLGSLVASHFAENRLGTASVSWMSWQYSCYEISFIWRSGARRWGAALDNKSLGQITVWIQVLPFSFFFPLKILNNYLTFLSSPTWNRHVMSWSLTIQLVASLFSSPCQRAAQSRLRYSVRLMNTMRCRAEIIVKPDVQVFFLSPLPPLHPMPHQPLPPEASTPLSHPTLQRLGAAQPLRDACLRTSDACLSAAVEIPPTFQQVGSYPLGAIWEEETPPRPLNPCSRECLAWKVGGKQRVSSKRVSGERWGFEVLNR